MSPSTFFCSAALLIASLSAGGSLAVAQTLSPGAHDFGDVVVGEQSAPQVFVLANTTPNSLIFSSATLGGADPDQFVITGTTCAEQIFPTEDCEVSAAFAPSAQGAASAQLQVNFLDFNGFLQQRSAELTGTGQGGVAAGADLAIDLGLDPSASPPGGALLLTANVSNLGADDAVGVSVSLLLPAGATNISADGAGWDCFVAAPSVECTRLQFPAPAEAPFGVQFNAPLALGSYAISGSVAAETADPDPTNNEDVVEFEVLPPAATQADLAIDLSLDETETVAGGALTLTAGIANLGDAAAVSVSVTVVFPAGASNLTAGGAGWACVVAAPAVECSRAELAALTNAPITVQFDAPDVVDQYEISGSVSAETADPVPANNEDLIQFAVVDEPPPPPSATPMPKVVPALDSTMLAVLGLSVLLLGWRMRIR